MEPQANDWNTGKPLHPDPDAFHKPVDHAVIAQDDKPLEGSGKDMGLVHAPVKSMHPTTQKDNDRPDKKEFKIIDDANTTLDHHIHKDGHYKFGYPFADLKVGQGISISCPKHITLDKFMLNINKQVVQYTKQASAVEKDEDGDDVMEDVAINKKKRNDDGTIQLDGDTPRLGIKSGFRPRLIGPTFAVKSVVKDDELSENNKADADGVLVIRMT